MITTPAIVPSVLTAYDSSGTGASCGNTYVLIPLAARQSAVASVNSSCILRESCAIATPLFTASSPCESM